MSRVGDKIKQARINAGITQKILAKKLGVAEKFINEVEMGKKILNEALIEKIAKVLNTDLNDVNMVVTDEDLKKEREVVKKVYEPKKSEVAPKGETDEVWNQAFGSVLKNVPIYDYSMIKTYGYKEMVLHSNKIEGHSVDKVFYLKIQNDDMSGFRITEGDIAFCHSIKDIENNSICLIELNDSRVIRQVKKLDSSKVLLISNKGSVKTETANVKDIKLIGKLDRLEIVL
ncbi:XRE family transcriptional regulator [Clostridium folliculivorans]|uniref:XRE family transcriptional regulator n=1 Tax=Clostridium folliculivorans TaxID=2886038 RepID=A0A9W5Y3E9_9CLOT|nr:XRE family transcriptional regulator [Clostridium folliculivorans]GKU26031.1 XRE family transcriptional regulator [Clostridium folliculivorans]GKU28117.1 XRE family transcriptional regulator [Clostridium folliculivorans]